MHICYSFCIQHCRNVFLQEIVDCPVVSRKEEPGPVARHSEVFEVSVARKLEVLSLKPDADEVCDCFCLIHAFVVFSLFPFNAHAIVAQQSEDVVAKLFLLAKL